MLKRLRQKFILTNTLYVGIVLAIVFVIVCGLHYKDRRENLSASLARALNNLYEPYDALGGEAEGGETPPHAIVVLSDAGETRVIERGRSISEDMLSGYVSRALANGDSSGDAGGGVYFVLLKLPNETRIALAEDAFIFDSTRAFAQTLVVIYLCATAPVVFASILVAKIAFISTENAWEQQKRFIADASHALKTPLTVILANIGILKGGRFGADDENRHWLNSTEEEAKDMHSLIDDMLVLAQSDLNVKRAHFTQVNYSQLITGLALQFEALAFDKRIHMETKVQEGVELSGDEKGLTQLASALMENALKYEREGGVVRIRLEKQVRRTVFSVYNASTWIRPDEKERIFDRFCRVKGAQTAGHEGHGLGLAIARSVADAHGATIDVDSSPSGGTEFRVTFRHIL